MSDINVNPSAGSVCAWHPRARASTTCERCGSFACLDCFEIVHGREICRECARVTTAPGASRPRRLLARGIDHLVASALIGVALDAVSGVSLEAVAALGSALLLLFLVQGVLLVRRGQTVGKWVMGITIRAPDGSRVPWPTLLLRRELPVFVATNLPMIVILALVFARANAADLFSVFNPAFVRTLFALTSVPAMVDALSIFREEERCIHDLIAGTVVVKARSESFS